MNENKTFAMHVVQTVCSLKVWIMTALER